MEEDEDFGHELPRPRVVLFEEADDIEVVAEDEENPI